MKQATMFGISGENTCAYHQGAVECWGPTPLKIQIDKL